MMYSDDEMINFFTKAVKENQPKKDRVKMNALRDAELMRINTELSKNPYMNMPYPTALSIEQIKRLKNKVASTTIPSIDTPNPNFGNVKKNFSELKSGENKNRWLEHVKKCMQEHPEYTYKEALKKCKETYIKKKK